MAYLALGDFTFELKEAQLNTIAENLALSFNAIKRIGNHPAYFNSGKFEESFRIRIRFNFTTSRLFKRL